MGSGSMEGRVYLRESGVNELAVVFNNNRLSYVGQDCQRIPPMLHMLYGPQVNCLDLSFNALESLWGLAEFPHLEELVLDNNLLNDAIHFPMLNKLHTLSLNKNKITNLDLLLTKVAHHFPRLTYLSLLGNVACPNQLSDCEKDEEDYRRYRYYVLHHLPRLQFLDSSRVTHEERLEAERRGHFMKVVRPNDKVPSDEEDSVDQMPYTPLPSSRRGIDDHRGIFDV
ncbi:leucine-rich melanocyte differentiation-associated protein-like isoform X2 [Ischnura elegans]|uniref:leucine-rich melanocyte differentiation-associated protein-like isoform X2 n=1 Tax=Ischnura elegans TaxID=197161 RepID=UPI001ED87156|nr:leucine-rich melanocyte differentiation-associated protein-like isoform X2 [Ischnura elegans]